MMSFIWWPRVDSETEETSKLKGDFARVTIIATVFGKW